MNIPLIPYQSSLYKVYCEALCQMPLQSQVILDLFVRSNQDFVLSYTIMILIEFHKTYTYESHVVTHAW